MRFFSLVWRLILFTLATALPFVLVGASIAGEKGAVIGTAVLGALLLGALFRTESGVLRIYRVRKTPPEGLSLSLKRVLAKIGGQEPRVFSFCDPSPQVLVVRGPLGAGSILVSEGLLGAVNEEDLRELLRASVLRLRERGMVFQSLCAWLSHVTLTLAPTSWVELLFGELRWHERLGAFGALRFVTVFSVARLFSYLGRIKRDPVRQLEKLPTVSGELSNPGSGILHFSAPWAERALLAL